MKSGPFRPGDQVPTTGIYTVAHYQHRLPHDVLVMAGDRFPECRRCGNRVSFSMSLSTARIDADRDLSEDDLSEDAAPVKAKQKSAGDS